MSQGSSSLLQESAFLSVRILTMDHYQASPLADVDATFSDFRSHVVRRVPVLRIFGSTPAGQKVCLHLHGIFPYIYVPVPEPCPAGYATKLAGSLDRALNLSMNQSEATQQVFKVEEVSGTPFYGYHPRQHSFFKVYFYNPIAVKRAADLLLNGGVMGAKLQPHEAHVPFTLQFMMDYNLQGMNFVHLAGVKFRRKAVTMEDITSDREEDSQSKSSHSQWLEDLSNVPSSSQRIFLPNSIPEAMLMPESVERIATTELEVDGVAADILNSNEAVGDDLAGMNPGLQALWEDERERRRLAGKNDSLTPPASPPRPEAALEPTESEKFWKQRLLQRLEKVREEQPELFQDDGSQSSDPNATCNFLASRSNTGEDEEESAATEEDGLVYPCETPDLVRLPSATGVSTHVGALSLSLSLEDRSSRTSSVMRTISKPPDSDSLPLASGSGSYADETIVDEEVVKSQSILQEVNSAVSRAASGAEHDGDMDLFDNENESAEQLSELMRRLSSEETSERSGSQVLTQLSFRSREREDEDGAISLEMSQAWDPDINPSENVLLQSDEEEDLSTVQAARVSDPNNPVWGSDDDDDFWQDLLKKNLT